ncbi:MAG: hypothetical protein OXG44_05095 [Gammaproteobacteria bacterium]|nr:hypothetical protein [Gammaproteobacteria bacterium]
MIDLHRKRIDRLDARIASLEAAVLERNAALVAIVAKLAGARVAGLLSRYYEVQRASVRDTGEYEALEVLLLRVLPKPPPDDGGREPIPLAA